MSVGQHHASNVANSVCTICRMKKENDGENKKTVSFQVIVHKPKTTNVVPNGKNNNGKMKKRLLEQQRNVMLLNG